MYEYAKERARLFTDEGLSMYCAIRDNVRRLLGVAGAVSMSAAMRDQTGDSWMMLACVDRMVEVGELVEVTRPSQVRGQDRVFVVGPKGGE
jgi:hypothetical protein